MGFTCGLYKYNKHGNDYTQLQYDYIEAYLSYEEATNSWAREHFKTAAEYAIYNREELKDIPALDDIMKFKDDYISRDWTKTIYEELGSWCSAGLIFHEWFIPPNLNKNEIVLTKEKAIKVLKKCTKKLLSQKFEPVIVDRAFVIENKDDNIDCSNNTYTSFYCDGVEIKTSDGLFRREQADDFEFSNLYIAKSYIDPDDFEVLKELELILIDIISDTDWDNQVIFYNGGW